jgi:putative NIF3 family GTP cyclohydrolase 1 type 2
MNLQDILVWSAGLAGCDGVPADSEVYLEAPADVNRVLFGVDIDVGELLYGRDAGFDAVIAHHPLGGSARTDFAKVVHRQVDQMITAGIPRDVAENAVAQRLERPHRFDHIQNVNRVVDTGRLIGLPFANIHLACDIIGRQKIVDLLTQRGTGGPLVRDALAWLDYFTEIRAGLTCPEVWVGDAANPLGRWVVAMAGGTNGGYPVFREYWKAGVDTIFAMHCAEDDLQRLRAEAPPGKSLVVTGHMATDSIGINVVIAGMEQRGIDVTRTSGIVAPGPVQPSAS